MIKRSEIKIILLAIDVQEQLSMSDRVVPDMKTASFCQCPMENCEIGPDDIDWCTGFWNEMAGEITPRYECLNN